MKQLSYFHILNTFWKSVSEDFFTIVEYERKEQRIPVTLSHLSYFSSLVICAKSRWRIPPCLPFPLYWSRLTLSACCAISEIANSRELMLSSEENETQWGYCINTEFTLTDLDSSCPGSLLKTTPPPPGYPWVYGGLYVTQEPRFSGLVLEHQGLEELEL